MIDSHAQRTLWQWSMLATLGSALSLPACSGKVQQVSDCRSDSSCAGAGGAAGGNAGSAADAGSAAASGAGASSAGCENLMKDANESDVDCGGSSKCARCLTNARCKVDGDCESAFCQLNRCADPACVDGVKNQDETDIDCGGSCSPCATGEACLANQDCSDEYCVKRVCTDHCLSGVRDSDETDKDCGGSACAPCADKRHCLEASDCKSLVCSSNSCRPATCNDRIKNQDESDLDCGGVCSASCLVGANCNTQADCESWICSAAGKCLADIAIPAADVIDDFEDGDLLLPASPARGGRVGNWYAFGDGSGVATLDVSGIERGASSVNGLQAKGKDFRQWGSGVGVDLNNSGADASTKVPYDASAYAGITFWARAESSTRITVALPDVDTDAAGQICSTCGHHYAKALQLATTWQRFTVAFSDLAIEPGTIPNPIAFKPSGLLSLEFMFEANQGYEVLVDDVAFVK